MNLANRLPTIPYVGIFGSSSSGFKDPELAPWAAIIDLLVTKGIGVINGGYGGTMIDVANAVVFQGGVAVGLTCEIVGDTNHRQSFTSVFSLETPFQRLEALVSLPDVLIFLPGGVGTLVELSSAIWSMDRGWIAPKTIVLLGAQWLNTVQFIREHPLGLRFGTRRPVEVVTINNPSQLGEYLLPVLEKLTNHD